MHPARPGATVPGVTSHPDTTLVLLGHGTSLNPRAALPVLQQASHIRRLGLFASVREAFWRQEPQVTAVLAAISTPRIVIVPCFLSEGYFSDHIIPTALGFPDSDGIRAIEQNGRLLVYCQPVGVHPHLTDVVLARAKSAVAAAPFPVCPKPADITLFIAGHGTERNANSRNTVEVQVDRIAALGQYASVQPLFLEEEPRIGRAYELARTSNIVIVPFLLGDGLHAQEDIPVMLGESVEKVQQRVRNGVPAWRNPTERSGKLVWYSNSVGTDPALAGVILEIAESAQRPAMS